jgi:sensor histidine kinase YesM
MYIKAPIKVTRLEGVLLKLFQTFKLFIINQMKQMITHYNPILLSDLALFEQTLSVL